MKRFLPLVFALFSLAWGGRAVVASAISDLVGSYELQGMMEMAGGLMLKADGKYLAGFSYGAADWTEEGFWKPEGAGIVLSGGRFKQRNTDKLPLFLPTGSRFEYRDGKLSLVDPERKLVFLDPNKTPSGKGKEAGEGRMRVKGKVVSLDAESLVLKAEECFTFDAGRLSDKVLQTAKAKIGKTIDVEIPYSAMLSASSCN